MKDILKMFDSCSDQELIQNLFGKTGCVVFSDGRKKEGVITGGVNAAQYDDESRKLASVITINGEDIAISDSIKEILIYE